MWNRAETSREIPCSRSALLYVPAYLSYGVRPRQNSQSSSSGTELARIRSRISSSSLRVSVISASPRAAHFCCGMSNALDALPRETLSTR